MDKKFLLQIVAVMVISCLPISANVDYRQLKYWHMCSEGVKEKNLDKPLAQTPTTKPTQPTFDLPAQTKSQKSFKLYDILSTLQTNYFAAPAQTEQQTQTLITLLQDLEVYCGQGEYPDVNVASLLDRTKSAAGAVVLRNMLAHPIASTRTQTFKDRQTLIQELISNEDLYDQVNALCTSWAYNEDRMLANWQELDELTTKLVNDHYYQYRLLQSLNANPYIMELSERVGNMASLVRALQIPLLWAAMTVGAKMLELTLQEQQQLTSLSTKFLVGCQDLCNIHVPRLYEAMACPISFYNNALQEFDQQISMQQYLSQLQGNPWNEQQLQIAQSVRKVMKAVFAITPIADWLLLSYIGYNAKSVYGQAKTHQDALNFIHDKLIGMGTVIRSATHLESLAEQHTSLSQGLVSWQHMQNVLHNSTNTEFAYLINLLQQDTFSGNASFFSFSGRVLVAHKLMEKYKNDFAGIIELIGELDACRSIAQIVKEFTNRSVHYCLADLYQADRPHMKLINFWNPFVDYRKVVTNNLELGGQNKELLVILTGSNTGGKSTVGLKGTLLSLYLAHTIGIAPADTCKASLFNNLCSYLHVLDDTASGQSSFQAEVNRSRDLIKAIKALPQNQHAFIVIDELFKGTSPEKGTSGAYKIVKHIAQFDNVMCIVATHFKELTQLEEETDGNCINMKIDVYEDEHGNLVRPHKLEYGISTQNIADAIMQSHFEDINFDL